MAREVSGLEPGSLLFGTDGIRERAGSGLLAPAEIEAVVAATASVLGGPAGFPEDGIAAGSRKVVIARDTRASGEEILSVVEAAFRRRGFTVLDLGVFPTPGAAFIASLREGVALGIVLSASHNPAEYNGIKFVAPNGAKVSNAFEQAVSRAYWDGQAPAAGGRAGAREDHAAEAAAAYVDHLVRSVSERERLRGRVVAIDTANGATFAVAPEVFRRLGMQVEQWGGEPDGSNINLDCGALHPGKLAAAAAARGAAIGFTFDGDGDRMIPVGARGTVFDGDHVLYLAARRYAAAGLLPRRTVVATVMSNFGLEKALAAASLRLERTDVGDRHVYVAMVTGGHPLGGEQSGHTIFLDRARTGDGILSALRLLDSLTTDDLDLDGEAAVIERYPQVLKNIHVREKRPFATLRGVNEAVERARAALAGRGRVLLRYSGTEPLARVMVEGDDPRLTQELTDEICEAIRRELVDKG